MYISIIIRKIDTTAENLVILTVSREYEYLILAIYFYFCLKLKTYKMRERKTHYKPQEN